jgi:heterodisulfide reductase subunit C
MSEINLPESIGDIDLFFERLRELSDQNVKQCMQCGTCTGACPMTDSMNVSPRGVMHLAQFGMEEKIQDLNTYWVCASCHSCSVRCPRGIDIARAMEALRQMSLRKNKDYVNPSAMDKDTLQDCPAIALVAGFRKLTS